ncbi:MAG: hypothetical protein R3C59_16005 [Planctomycetaceae bacterium]
MLNLRYCLLMSTLLTGCADSAGPVPETTTLTDSATALPAPTDDTTAAANNNTSGSSVDDGDDFDFAPLSTSAAGSGTSKADTRSAGEAPLSEDAGIRAVMLKLKPLQVMLGQWRGTTRKEYDGFKAVDSHEWIWDLKTHPQQPALVVQSDRSPYLKTASLTWNVARSEFQLTATDSSGVTREFAGDYTDPVHEIVGPDDRLHRVFRLQLTQTDQSAERTGGDVWQIAFVQQENNRYLLEVDKRRGSADFRRYDTVSTQREGTSFAISDSDYGEKSCIISQGLGTIAVSHKGRTYWVCCSGCKAAFEDDPETWIARAEKRAKDN